MEIRVEPTPNPNAMKFAGALRVSAKPVTYASAEAAEAHPAAKSLFLIPGVRSLFFLNDFVTVTKDPAADWQAIVPKALALLEEHGR